MNRAGNRVVPASCLSAPETGWKPGLLLDSDPHVGRVDIIGRGKRIVPDLSAERTVAGVGCRRREGKSGLTAGAPRRCSHRTAAARNQTGCHQTEYILSHRLPSQMAMDARMKSGPSIRLRSVVSPARENRTRTQTEICRSSRPSFGTLSDLDHFLPTIGLRSAQNAQRCCTRPSIGR